MLQERDLLLITGVPGTGKTTYGGMFATEFGFVHHDLEDQQTLNRFVANRAQFIGELLNEKKNVVVTWGFAPDDEPSVSLVLQLRSAGFEWIWFDGNRPAALREFLKTGHCSGNRSLCANVPNRKIRDRRTTKTNSY
ncbi:MAG: hypothetical protein WA416_20095 [Candidatus Sulfotelmatobacter sp.]